jgi:hypothetical protein
MTGRLTIRLQTEQPSGIGTGGLLKTWQRKDIVAKR